MLFFILLIYIYSDLFQFTKFFKYLLKHYFNIINFRITVALVPVCTSEMFLFNSIVLTRFSSIYCVFVPKSLANFEEINHIESSHAQATWGQTRTRTDTHRHVQTRTKGAIGCTIRWQRNVQGKCAWERESASASACRKPGE